MAGFDFTSISNAIMNALKEPKVLLDARVVIVVEPPPSGSLVPKIKFQTSEKVLGVPLPGLDEEVDPVHAVVISATGIGGLFSGFFKPKGG